MRKRAAKILKAQTQQKLQLKVVKNPKVERNVI
jgi:hypothetical protein